jgi:GT2 family glycosyltransferase
MLNGTKKLTVQITTRNRLTDLLKTLALSVDILEDERVETILCIDGYEPETEREIKHHYPNIRILTHGKPKGLIACRNKMMAATHTPYALSLDDDLTVLTPNSVNTILDWFEQHPRCAVVSFSIYWSLSLPATTHCDEHPNKIRGFAGGAHAFRMEAWRSIRPYPEWYIFYGEEEYASMQLFKKGWEVNYLPYVLCHHRVDINMRKTNGRNYIVRQMRSYRAGLYNIACFFPLHVMPKIYAYSLLNQFKTKTLKGDWKATLGIIFGILSFTVNLYRLPRYSARFSRNQYTAYMGLHPVPLYWNPKVKP